MPTGIEKLLAEAQKAETERANALLDKARKVWNWQYGKFPVHELTCGNDNCRAVLAVGIKEDDLFLVCLKCGYVQDWIPFPVLGE